jgi:CSLREA domain-containing protein
MVKKPLIVLALLLLPNMAAGATFVVNSTLDAVDAEPGDGVCSTAGGVCALRAAVQEANALAGNHVITLGALANNGGSSQTVLLSSGSPAIDAGDDAACTAAPVSGADQRGIPRPSGEHCDIGAVEAAGARGTTDFDSDGKTDLALYRPSAGYWYIKQSGTNYTTYQSYQWGLSTDLPVSGDYDGDGKSDVAVYRPSTGYWYILQSSTNYTTFIAQQWGLSTDIPVQGDYDGDGKSDLGLYRPSAGYWYVLLSSANYTTYIARQWGLSTDIPVRGDYDGDGKSDLGLYRPSAGYWYVLLSSANYTTYIARQWGLSTDVPVPGDYDGDGKSDLALYRPSAGYWYVLQSGSSFMTYLTYQWGLSTDLPAPGDYDGDGKADLALYRPSAGYWYVLQSSTGYTTYLAQQWGLSTDIPVSSSPLRAPAGSGRAATTVSIVGINGSLSFSPNPAAAQSGGTVTWHNADGLTHRIVLDDLSYDSGNLPPGSDSPALAVGAAGATYHCSIHPTMVGTITSSP